MIQQYKKSKIRDTVFQVLQGTRAHPPADWIWAEVKKHHASATLASVYRNLSILESQGKIVSFETNQGERRFDAFVHEHAHFVCKRCGNVYDCDVNVKKKWRGASLPGVIDSYQLVFFGVCVSCHKQKKIEGVKNV